VATVDLTAGPDVVEPHWTRVGPLVACETGVEPYGHGGLLIWHWCDHHLWAGRPHFDAHPDEYPARWVPAGAGAHDLVSLHPLHLEPSVYWPGCCGLHGFIRNGVWTDA